MESLIEILTDSEKFQIVIQNISSYVTYVYPGLLSIYVNNFLHLKSTKETQALIIKSFSISFLYIKILEFLSFPISDKQSIEYNAILFIMSIILPVAFFKIKCSSIVRDTCYYFGIVINVPRAPYDFLQNNKDEKYMLKVYLKDEGTSYLGKLRVYEHDDDKEKFIILSKYKKYKYRDGKEVLVTDYSKKKKNKVVIKYEDIKVMEKITEETTEQPSETLLSKFRKFILKCIAKIKSTLGNKKNI